MTKEQNQEAGKWTDQWQKAADGERWKLNGCRWEDPLKKMSAESWGQSQVEGTSLNEEPQILLTNLGSQAPTLP